MRRITTFIVILLGALQWSCATTDGTPVGDIEINAEADDKANFSNFKSYAWFGSEGIKGDTESQWETPQFDADSAIRALVEKELAKRGMKQTTTNPDVLVTYALGNDLASLKLMNTPEETRMFNVENVPNGALVFMLVDPLSYKTVWAGIATANSQQQASTNIREKRIEYVVTGMLEELPD